MGFERKYLSAPDLFGTTDAEITPASPTLSGITKCRASETQACTIEVSGITTAGKYYILVVFGSEKVPAEFEVVKSTPTVTVLHPNDYEVSLSDTASVIFRLNILLLN